MTCLMIAVFLLVSIRNVKKLVKETDWGKVRATNHHERSFSGKAADAFAGFVSAQVRDFFLYSVLRRPRPTVAPGPRKHRRNISLAGSRCVVP